MRQSPMGKYGRLKDVLGDMRRVALAFSGGVDSALLAVAAHDALGDNVLALTGNSRLFPGREIDESACFCKERGIKQVVFEMGILDRDDFCRNPPDRCYLCKHALLARIRQVADEHGFGDAVLVEGSNLDDAGDYRPGSRAIRELGVRSPLVEAGLTKADIRAISNELGLPTWDKPSFACLASRIPYGDEISEARLSMIDRAEQALIDLGFCQPRVRVHGAVARIEIPREDFGRFMSNDTPDRANQALRDIGFRFVSLDLGGYRTGNMNTALND